MKQLSKSTLRTILSGVAILGLGACTASEDRQSFEDGLGERIQGCPKQDAGKQYETPTCEN